MFMTMNGHIHYSKTYLILMFKPRAKDRYTPGEQGITLGRFITAACHSALTT